jgi:hypothetical protein
MVTDLIAMLGSELLLALYTCILPLLGCLIYNTHTYTVTAKPSFSQLPVLNGEVTLQTCWSNVMLMVAVEPKDKNVTSRADGCGAVNTRLIGSCNQPIIKQAIDN